MNEVSKRDRRAELGEINFQGGNLFQPTNGKELMDMANVLSQSGTMLNPIYRGKPGDCAGLIALCAPYGFNPIQVSWKTYKASKTDDAPIAFEAQLVNAMVNQSAPIKGKLRYVHSGDGPTRRCKVIGIDRETDQEIDYETPQIKDIRIQNSPLWKSDPDQQLAYYAARSWARRHFPEMLLGVYVTDEIETAPMRDVTPARKTMAERLAEEQVQTPEVEPEDVSQDVADAEVLPPEDGITPDPSNGFPGSDEFEQGAKAFAAGEAYDANPYTSDQQKADDWAGGWSGAQGAAA